MEEGQSGPGSTKLAFLVGGFEVRWPPLAAACSRRTSRMRSFCWSRVVAAI